MVLPFFTLSPVTCNIPVGHKFGFRVKVRVMAAATKQEECETRDGLMARFRGTAGDCKQV